MKELGYVNLAIEQRLMKVLIVKNYQRDVCFVVLDPYLVNCEDTLLNGQKLNKSSASAKTRSCLTELPSNRKDRYILCMRVRPTYMKWK